MRALSVESIVQMALMNSEDTIRVRKAQRSSDKVMKKVKKSQQAAQKRARLTLERTEGAPYVAGEF